jgi:hypothetical protein
VALLARHHGQHAYPTEGRVVEADGAEIDVSLYANENHRLFELELVKRAEGRIVGPDWSTFRIRFQRQDDANLAETEGFEPSMRFWHILP